MKARLPTVIHVQTRCRCHVWMGLNGTVDSSVGTNFARIVVKATIVTNISRLFTAPAKPVKTEVGGETITVVAGGWDLRESWR